MNGAAFEEKSPAGEPQGLPVIRETQVQATGSSHFPPHQMGGKSESPAMPSAGKAKEQGLMGWGGPRLGERCRCRGSSQEVQLAARPGGRQLRVLIAALHAITGKSGLGWEQDWGRITGASLLFVRFVS